MDTKSKKEQVNWNNEEKMDWGFPNSLCVSPNGLYLALCSTMIRPEGENQVDDAKVQSTSHWTVP